MTRRTFACLGGGIGAALAAGAASPWSARLGIMCQFPPEEKAARAVLESAAKAGFQRTQVFFAWNKAQPAFLDAFPGWLRSAGLRCEALGAYVNCVAPDVVLMNTRAEDFARAIDYAARLDCKRLVAWTGGHAPGLMQADPRNFTPQAEDALVRFLSAHYARLEQAGVQVALESYITLACPDAPSLRRVLDRMPPFIGAVLDPPNLTPVARFADRDRVLREMVHTLAGRVTVVHLKDFRLSGNGQGYELPGPLGGEMNYHLFVEQIRTLPADVPVIMEHLPPDKFAEARRRVLPLFAG